ncbi:DUF3795 domain-containing protein [Chloroflexota bacterium]
MSDSAFDLTAYCGLYCADCLHRLRSKASDLAQDLLAELDDSGFDKYAEAKSSSSNQPNRRDELKHYPEFRNILETIIELKCGSPCRVGGGCPTFNCKIMECCISKGLDGCWQCDIFEACDQFDFLKLLHGNAPIENLKMIKKYGFDSWIEHRRKFYVWD